MPRCTRVEIDLLSIVGTGVDDYNKRTLEGMARLSLPVHASTCPYQHGASKIGSRSI